MFPLADTTEEGDRAVFAFAGQGWRDGRVNYIAALDFPATGIADSFARNLVPLMNGKNGVIDRMARRGAELAIAIIDASHENPFRTRPPKLKTIGVPVGLVRSEPPPVGSFVFFSAGPGERGL